MQDEFRNRLGMGKTVLATLDLAIYTAIWQGQPPLVFTTKVGLLRTMLGELGDLMRDQEAIITGFATLKDGRELELEDLAHEVGQALASYYEDQGHADLAAAVDFSISDWRKLAEDSLVGRAQVVEQSLTNALATSAAALVDYDLDAADLTALSEAIADYNKIIKSPQAAISNRKALTGVLRPRFRELSTLLSGMDKLVLRFRKTPAGRQFADAYLAARIVRDLGSNSGNNDPAPPPANP